MSLSQHHLLETSGLHDLVTDQRVFEAWNQGEIRLLRAIMRVQQMHRANPASTWDHPNLEAPQS